MTFTYVYICRAPELVGLGFALRYRILNASVVACPFKAVVNSETAMTAYLPNSLSYLSIAVPGT